MILKSGNRVPDKTVRPSGMRRAQRIVLIATIIAVLPMLAGCADFDMDKLDVFGLNEKKKLPGDRKPLFPEGVPGVSQGIPPEYIKGNQPPPETAQPIAVEPEKKAAAIEPVEAPKPKPKRKKPKAVAAAPTKPVTQTDQPAPAPEAAPWPAQPQQQQPQQSSSAPWPSAPAPGTFSR